MPSWSASSRDVLADAREDGLVVADEVDLVHREYDVRHPEQPGDGEVPPGLLQYAVPGVDQDDHDIRGRGAGHGVAGVLHVSGAVGQDERALVGGEVPVGDVDRDALFAFGAQAVGEQGEVEVTAAGLGDRLHVRDLVGEDRLAVVQQPAHQGRLAVVDRARRGEPQSCRGEWVLIRSTPLVCGLPWRLRWPGRRRGWRRAR